MIRIKSPNGSKLLLASFVAAGVAATPATFGSSFNLTPHNAAAQTDGSQDDSDVTSQDRSNATSQESSQGAGDEGFAVERAERQADGMSMASEESVYEILGTTRDEAEAADTVTSATAQNGSLRAYEAEVERGNLDAAAENLAAIAEHPITEEMVTDVNMELGIETTLTAKQIAETAARKQEDGDS